jgi:uncharacterized protein (TIGR00725 family)
VAVIGASEPDPARDAQAHEVGAEVARAGAVLVSGGLGGVMEASCAGARQEGGSTVGLLPGDDRAAANSHLDVALATGLGELRNGLIVRAADAVIAVGGGYGTLSEIGFALRLGRPVVGLGTWELARAGVAEDGVVRASDPADAVQRALAAAAG